MAGRAVSRWCGMLVLVLGYAFGASAQDAPGIPDLQIPSDGSLAEPTTTLLTWSPTDGATSYHLQVSTDMDFSTTVSDQPALGDTSFSVSGLAYATVYYWQVEAVGPGGESGWPDYPQAFTTVITGPLLSMPAANAVNQPVSLTLGWNGDSGADSYELQVSQTSNFLSPAYDQSGITGTSQAVGGLTNSTLYYWRVLASNSGGDGSAWSFIDSFTTIIQAPGAPGLSSPADNAVDQATNPAVAWTAGSLASNYTVRFSPVSDFSSGVISLSGITGTSTTASGLANGTLYYYEVQSVNIGGATWSAAWSFTTIIGPPDAPALSSPAAGAVNQPLSVTLTWNSAARATAYSFQISTDQAFGSTIAAQSGLADTSGSATLAQRQTLYYWRVIATNRSGNDPGPWSSVWSFTSIPTVPGSPSLVLPANNDPDQPVSPLLQWKTVSGATSYNYQLATTSTFATTIATQTGIVDTFLTIGPLAASTNYWWRVNATNAGGTSNWSKRNFTVPALPAGPGLSLPANNAGNVSAAITLSWQSVTGPLNSYEVQVSTDNFVTTSVDASVGSGTTSYTGSTLASSTYYWRVGPTNGGGQTWSAPWTFTVPAAAASMTLATPANAAPNVSVNPTLTWNAVAGVPVTSYTILISDVSSFGDTLNNSTFSSATTSCGITHGSGIYYWKVGALNGGGMTWSAAQSFTIPTAASSVTLTTPVNNAPNVWRNQTFTWGAVAGVPVTSYNFQLSTVSNFATTVDNQSLGSGITSYKETDTLQNNTTYYWQVAAINGGGTTWSATWTFTVPANAGSVTLAIPANAAPNVSVNPTLTWNAVAGVPVTSYSIVVSDASGFTDTLAKSKVSSATTSYAATLGIGTYYWKVGSLNGGGMTWSAAQSFTIPAAASSVTLTTPVNNASNVWRNQTFTWGAVAGVPVTSYNFQLSTVSSFATTVDNQTFGPGTTSYKETDTLQNNATYYWQVSATNGGGTTWSATWTFTVPANAGSVTLATPANAAPNVSVNPTLTWNAVAGVPVTSYTIVVSDASGFTDTLAKSKVSSATTSYAATLGIGTYYWKVGSLNGGGMTWSTAQSFTIPAVASSVALTTPVNNAPNVWRNQTFTWGAVAGVPVTSYNFQLSTVSNFATTVDNQSLGSGITSYKETDTLQNNTTYYWQVAAINGGGTTWSATWTFTVPANAGSVTLATPANAAPNVSVNPTLTWNAVAGVPVTSYTIVVSDASGFTDTLAKSKLSSATTSYAATLGIGTYYWKVGSLNGGGMTWSTAQSFTIPAAASSVTLTTPVNNAANVWRNQTFTWGAVASVPVTSYNFQLSTVSSFATTVDNQTFGPGTTTYKETDTLQNNQTYYWQVAAINGGGTTWSATWTFTVPANAGSVTLGTPANAAPNVSVNPTLSWNAVAGVPVTSYHLQISVSSGFGSTVDAESFGSGTTSYAATLGIGTYYWKIGSLNGGGMTWSTAQSFTIPAAASSVSLSTPVNNAPNVWRNQTFTWSAVSSVPVTSYHWQLSTVSNFAATVDDQTFGSGTTTYKETDTLQNNATYYWQVSATNGGGTTWSATWTFTVPANAGSVTLATPANAAPNVSVNPTLTWNAVAGVPVTSYTIVVSDASGFTDTLAKSKVSSATTSYAATLGIGTYYWKVGSLNGGGMTWSTAQSFTIPAAASSVALTTPVNNAPNVWRNQTFTWSAVAGVPVTSYNFQLSTVSNFATTVDNQSFGPGTTTYKETDTLQNNQTYYWQVAATNGGGTMWSATWTFTVPANAGSVTLATPANASPNLSANPTLTWNAVAGVPVNSYTIVVSDASGFTDTLAKSKVSSATTSYAATLGIGTYYWKVGSLNGGGMTWSSAWSFTIPVAASSVTLSTPVNNASNVWRNQTFAWEAVASVPVTSYNFQLSTVSNFATTIDNQLLGSGITSYKETDTLQSNATYYWQVSATNSGGTTWSATWTFTVPANAGSVTLATPANAAPNVSVNPTLSWNAVAGEPVTSYTIVVSDASGFTDTLAKSKVSSATTSYGATLPSGTYYWKVGSLNGGGMTWSSAWSFTIPATASSVTLSTPVNNAPNVWRNQTFTWEAVASVPVTSYNFQLSTVSSFATTVDNQTFGPGTTTYKETDTLQNNTTYYWQVAAINGGGTMWSATWTFTVPANAGSVTLATPANAAPNVSVNPTLTWNAVAGVPVTSYTIVVSDASGFTDTLAKSKVSSATLSYAATLPIGTYYWKVGSLNGGGMTWSAAQSFTIPAAASLVTLSAPVNNASNVWRNQTFTWEAVAGVPVTTYNFQLSTVSNFATTIDNQLLGSGITSYKETDTLQNNATYYWQVSATNSGGTTWSATWTFTVPANAGSVTLGTPANAAPNVSVNPTLTWNAVAGVPVTSYHLQISASSGFGSTVDAESFGSGTTSYAATLGSGTYYWEVGSLNGGGMTWSSAWSFTIPAVASSVALTTPVNYAPNVWRNQTFTWEAVASVPVTSYNFQLSTVSNFATTVDNQTFGPGTTSYKETDTLQNNTTYYWQVSATNGGGTTWSATWTFTVPANAGSVTLATPANAAPDVPVNPTLTWNAVAGVPVTSYTIVVSDASGFTDTLAKSKVSSATTSYAATLPIGTYYWKVGSLNGGGMTWSTAQSFTIPSAASSVTLSTPVNNASNVWRNQTFTWEAVAGVPVTSYNFQLSTVSNFATTIDNQLLGSGITSYKETDTLQNNATYYWQVAAINGGGTTWSATWTFTVPANAGSVTLATPANAAPNVSVNPTLTWNAVAGVPVNSYTIVVSDASGFTDTLAKSKVSSATTSYAATLPSGTYYWEVGSLNGGGMTWSTAQSFTIPAAASSVALSTPVNNASNVWRNQTFTWEAVASVPVTSYNFQLSTVSSFATTVDNQTFGPGTTTYKETDTLQNNQTYYWQVSATNGGGTTWSATWTFTVPANAGSVTLATPANAAPDVPVNPTLTWNAVVGVPVTSYTIVVSDASGFTDTLAKSKVSSATTSYAATLGIGTYYWEVGALNGGGMTWSSPQSFTIPNIPGAVVLSSPTIGTQNTSMTPVLSWSANPLAAFYTVQISTTSAFSSTVTSATGITGLSMEPPALPDSTEYYWQVAATNAVGTGPWSSVWNFTTIPNVPVAVALSAPVNGVLGTPLSLSLNWSAVSRAASYRVQVSTTGDFSSTVVDDSSLAVLSQAIAGLTNNMTYAWRVRATNAAGAGAWSTVWDFSTIVGSPALSLPVNNAIGQPITSSVSWSATGGAVSYGVQVSTASGFATTIFSQSGITGMQSAIGPLPCNTLCFWRVNATNAGGTGAWSAAWNFTTIVAAPLLAYPLDNAINIPTNMTLSWNQAANAVSYLVQVSSSATFATGSILDSVTQSSVTRPEAGLTNTMEYYWRVRAITAGGYGAWSVDSFTIITPLAVAIPAGWNMIGLNIHPADSAVATVFNAPKGFILVKGISGNAYIPSLGINDLGTMSAGQGYQVYTSVTDTVRTQGSVINTASTPLPLSSEWNMIACIAQADVSIETVFSGIESQVMLVKNNDGCVYWPYFGVDNIDTMTVGQGYLVCMLNPAVLTFPAGQVAKMAANRTMLRLPAPRHYALALNTGNSATLLARKIAIGNDVVGDSCEVGAFNAQGKLVGSGTVRNGIAAFSLWGVDPQSTTKPGLKQGESITFKLWDGRKEYPLEFQSTTGGTTTGYKINGIFNGMLSVPAGFLITRFDLARVYPNPFKEFLRIAFDVPTIDNVSVHSVEIDLFDMKGTLVHQIAKGEYSAGHYLVSWNGEGVNGSSLGSGFYVIRMKAQNFDKIVRLVRMR